MEKVKQKFNEGDVVYIKAIVHKNEYYDAASTSLGDFIITSVFPTSECEYPYNNVLVFDQDELLSPAEMLKDLKKELENAIKIDQEKEDVYKFKTGDRVIITGTVADRFIYHGRRIYNVSADGTKETYGIPADEVDMAHTYNCMLDDGK